jgi:hypothetical protein
MDHGSLTLNLQRWMMTLIMALLREATHGWGAGSAGPVLTEVDRGHGYWYEFKSFSFDKSFEVWRGSVGRYLNGFLTQYLPVPCDE